MRAILTFFLILSFTTPATANPQPFDQWLAGIRGEAARAGISQTTINAALSDIRPLQKAIELDRKQPEKKITFAQYKNNIVNQARIDKGRRLMRQHAAQLRRVEQQYGVAPQYIVALWGIETNFGSNTGGFSVVEALATLAWEGRRAEFFKTELFNALKIIDAGHISAGAMKGSWAGAMGQNQFMPSSFNAYAVDGNGDGRRDIWGTLDDVFASSANYLAKSGWAAGERWGRRVRLPSGFSADMVGLDTQKTLAEWSRLGVRLPGGGALPGDDMTASIVAPDGVTGEAYLAYNNYRTIMKWNRSTYFATSVGLLADAIASGGWAE
jgi:membrane-bound lytic murein transglycosylase B